MSQPMNVFPLSYTGVRAKNPPNIIVKNFDPSPTASQNVDIGDMWINFNPSSPALCKIWILLGLAGGVANWVEFASGSGDLLTLTGNTGGAISPLAGNINIVTANSTVLVAGAGHTLTMDFGLSNLLLGSPGTSIIPPATNNTALGITALEALTTGSVNVAIGNGALFYVDTGTGNTGVGAGVIGGVKSGADNTGIGRGALNALGTGSGAESFNTAVGSLSLFDLTEGNNNIALGYSAGSSYTTTESSNIVIGNVGLITENNVLRIGTQGSGVGQQNKCFIAGINTVTVANAAPVTINTVSGQLGVGGSAGVWQIVNSINNAVSPAELDFIKNRSGGPVQAGDQLSELNFEGYDSTSTPISAGLIRVDCPASATIAANRVAGDMKFFTHQDVGIVNPILRMTLDNTGVLTLEKADTDSFGSNNPASFYCKGSSIISSNNAASTTSPLTQLLKTRNLGPITSGDGLGIINFTGYDSTSSPVVSASITSTSSGTIALNRVAGNLVFSTHPDSAAGSPSQRMQITPSGNVSINQADNDTFAPAGTTTASFDVTGSSIISTNNNANATGAETALIKTRAGGVITTGDLLGEIQFNGTDSTPSIQVGAAIRGVSTGTIAATRIPAQLQFFTHPDSAAASPTLRMTIHENGVVTVASPDTSVAAVQVTGSISAGGDPGVGTASSTDLTNATAAAGGAGTFTIKSGSANPANSTGFIKIYVNGVAKYIPFFDNPAP